MKQAELIIIGGANGSGKTTFARELVAKFGIKYLGADEIAAELNAEKPADSAIEAARIFSRRLAESIETGESLLVESTLSGVSLKKFLVAAKANNFKISIYFVYLDSAELCVNRVASRVARGGHHVPPEDVRRRFQRSNHNFWNVYKTLADDWNLFFNVGDGFRQIAVGDKKDVIIFDETRYSEWLKMAVN
jgi:predicted ABC-type ATPase